MRSLGFMLLSGWVLWVNAGFADDWAYGKTRWLIHEAFESRAECYKARGSLMVEVEKSFKQRGEDARISEHTITSTSKEGRPHIAQYYCLPAEVDPRPRG